MVAYVLGTEGDPQGWSANARLPELRLQLGRDVMLLGTCLTTS